MLSPYLLASVISLVSVGVSVAIVALGNLQLQDGQIYWLFGATTTILFYLACALSRVKMTLVQKLVTPILYLGVGPWCSAVILGTLY